MPSTRSLLACLAAVLALLLPATASAATTWYASPTGTSAAGCMSTATACDVTTAFNDAGPGDTLVLAGGDYPPLTAALVRSTPITITGGTGPNMPVLHMSGPNGIMVNDPTALPSTPSSISQIAINYTGAWYGLQFDTSGAVNQVSVTATTGNACEAHVYNGNGGFSGTLEFSNSLCVTEASGKNALTISAPSVYYARASLDNDTAVATGATGFGLLDQSLNGAIVTATATNDVFVGGTDSVFASAGSASSAIINISYSDYASSGMGGQGVAEVNSGGGHNSTAAPGSRRAATRSRRPRRCSAPATPATRRAAPRTSPETRA